MNGNEPPKHAKRGFTLVELLTVIIIIGILAALVSAAVVAAVRKAKEARVTLEIGGLGTAMKLFKEKYGDFPPDTMANAAEMEAFLTRAFPRYTKGTYGSRYARFCTEVQNVCGVNPASMDSASSMVFWLGGLPQTTGTWIPDGFSQDVEYPFTLRATTGDQRTKPLFEFKPDRIYWSGNVLHYYPDLSGARAADCPYVYFRYRNDSNYTTAGLQLTRTEESKSVSVRPYINSQTNVWANIGTFQIISAGMDNLYGGTSGAAPSYPAGSYNGTTGHYDNLTNFTEGKLEDAQ